MGGRYRRKAVCWVSADPLLLILWLRCVARRSGAQSSRGHGEYLRRRTARCERQFDAPDADRDSGPELEEREPDRAASRAFQLGAGKSDAAHRAHQHVGERGQEYRFKSGHRGMHTKLCANACIRRR